MKQIENMATLPLAMFSAASSAGSQAKEFGGDVDRVCFGARLSGNDLWPMDALVLVLSNCLSIAGCGWLVHRILLQRSWLRARLFPRQLMSLACADFGLHIGVMLAMLLTLARVDLDTSGCRFYFLWFRSFRFISLLQEMHIAAAFLYQACRWSPIMQCCKIGVPLIWVLGFCLGAIDLVAAPVEYSDELQLCEMTQPDEGANLDYLTFGMLFLSLVVSCASYVSLALRSCSRSPSSVQRSALKRVGVYQLNFVLTNSLPLVALFHTALWTDVCYMSLAVGLQSCSGFFNALTYAMTAQFSTVLRKDQADTVLARRRERRGSGEYPVEVSCGVDIIEFMPEVEDDACSSHATSLDSESTSSTSGSLASGNSSLSAVPLRNN